MRIGRAWYPIESPREFSHPHRCLQHDTNFGSSPSCCAHIFGRSSKRTKVKKRCACITLLLVNGSETYRQEVGAYCASIGLPVVFYEIGAQVETAFAGGVEENTKWTLAIYGRLFMAEVLPPEVERAVYMDFDTVCVGNLRELLAQTVGCQTVAGSRQSAGFLFGREGRRPERCGVLVVPVAEWRRGKIAAQLVAVFMDHKRRGEPVPFPRSRLAQCRVRRAVAKDSAGVERAGVRGTARPASCRFPSGTRRNWRIRNCSTTPEVQTLRRGVLPARGWPFPSRRRWRMRGRWRAWGMPGVMGF